MENVERIGLVVDRIDSCITGLEMRIAPEIHVSALKEILPEIKQELKKVFFALGGDKDTWD